MKQKNLLSFFVVLFIVSVSCKEPKPVPNPPQFDGTTLLLGQSYLGLCDNSEQTVNVEVEVYVDGLTPSGNIEKFYTEIFSVLGSGK